MRGLGPDVLPDFALSMLGCRDCDGRRGYHTRDCEVRRGYHRGGQRGTCVCVCVRARTRACIHERERFIRDEKETCPAIYITIFIQISFHT